MNRYQRYLNSKTWRKRRYAALERAGFRCSECNERDGLQVHHLTYKRLGKEKPADLKVLCQTCHWMADRIRENPAFEIPVLKADKKTSINPIPILDVPDRLPAYSKARKVVKYDKGWPN